VPRNLARIPYINEVPEDNGALVDAINERVMGREVGSLGIL
jgi:hypothetical protein